MNNTFYDYTKKIDNLAVDGLLGVVGSVGYILSEMEKHLHNNEKWFGEAAVPDGELHVADRLTTSQVSFRIEVGNDQFGNWFQILGSLDTPVAAGMTKFDLHRLIFTAHTHNTTEYDLQIVCGESAGIAAKLVAEDFTEFPIITGTGVTKVGPEAFMARRCNSGDKVWMRARANGKTSGFPWLKPGIHEYIG